MSTTSQQHSDHAMAETNHNRHSQGNSHAEVPASTQAELTISDKINTNTSVSLLIDIRDMNGNAVTEFDRFQEQVMHLIAVSDDLQIFQHLHSVYQGNGRFEAKAQFPQPGNYTLFSDYKPVGQAEQVAILKVQVDGTGAATAQIDWSYTKTFEQTIVDFAPTKAPIKVGEDITLGFALQDADTHQPVTDLQTYLGEKGHLVILRQSSALSREDYVHAHAVQNTPANQVHFATRFPRSGNYKLWGQCNRNGKIITADFWGRCIIGR